MDIHINEMFQIKTALNSMNILCGVWVWDSQSSDYEEFWDPRIRCKSADISEEQTPPSSQSISNPTKKPARSRSLWYVFQFSPNYTASFTPEVYCMWCPILLHSIIFFELMVVQ